MKRCAAAEAARAAADARSLLMEARSHDDGGDAARRALADVRKELDGVRAELLRERHAHFERAEPPIRCDGGDVDARRRPVDRLRLPLRWEGQLRLGGRGPPDDQEVEEAYFADC